MSFNIAIDGPSGAGKSTIAKKTAKKLNFIYIDTGAMYRAMALYFLKNQVDTADEDKIAACCGEIDISISYLDGEQQVILNGENVTGSIRTEEVGNTASATSGYQSVRKKLVELQRNLAIKENVIMDGRDIGTCVLPNAQLKIFLTASVLTRGKRRYHELVNKGVPASLEEVCKDMKERDDRDMNREISPLKMAEDAILLDTSDMNIDEVVQTILGYVTERKVR